MHALALARRGWPPLSRRTLRLASGLLLFAYIALHFIDHALGLVSVAVADRALAISVALWQSLPGSLLLYGAAAVHVALALLAIFERQTLRMPPAQALRIALGLGMPLLVVGHVVATRIAAQDYGLAPSYERIVWALWTSDGEGRQLALLAPGWLHGCMGLALAFGHRPLAQRLRLPALGLALLLPVLAALGFLAMGRELAVQQASAPARVAASAPAATLALGRLRDGLLGGYLALVGAVLVAREGRAQLQRTRHLQLSIAYPQRTVAVPRGWSVLEASRGHGIAHLSSCGGRARCSTCRVRVIAGAEHCPPPSVQEQATLERVQAAGDVRLACQLRPLGDIAVLPLLQAQVGDGDAPARGIEIDAALLVLKVLRWRPLTAATPTPHDLAYALESLHGAVATAVAAAGGQLRCDSQGAEAVFGLAADGPAACAQALRAAATVEVALDALAPRLRSELGVQADLALALHAGPLVWVPLGRDAQRARVPVGACVDAAHALCACAAAAGCRWALSQDLVHGAGWPAAEWPPLDAAGTPVQALLAHRLPGRA